MNPSRSGVLPLNLVKAWCDEGLKSLSRFVRYLLPWPLPLPRGLQGSYLVSFIMLDGFTVVVKRQVEGVGKRAQDKLRAQGIYKPKTRVRSERKGKKTLKATYG